MCGKNERPLLNCLIERESPPRVREKPPLRSVCVLTLRITPACAGKTQMGTLYIYYNWDHPRVCGKNPKELNKGRLLMGSPPRVREKLFLGAELPKRYGITPACAGKTWLMTR